MPWCFSVMAVVLLTSAPAAAGEFVINPLRVTLDRTTRATEVVVRNDDKTPLRMQVQAMTWTNSSPPWASCTSRERWR